MRVVQNVALPQDNTRVDPSTFLEAWVTGIQVYDLPVGAFTGGSLQFIVSSTDAPATNERRNGTLWFKRGEGRLYIWDQSQVSGGTKGWLSLSDRRDIWVGNLRHVAPPGTPLTFNESTSNTELTLHGFETTTVKSPPPWRPLWSVFPLTAESDGSLPSLSEFVVITLETATTDGITRACEHGFVDFRMGSGETGAGGFARILGGQGGGTGFIDGWSSIMTAQSEITGMVKGFYTDSSATQPGTQWTRPGYLFQNPPIGVTHEF